MSSRKVLCFSMGLLLTMSALLVSPARAAAQESDLLALIPADAPLVVATPRLSQLRGNLGSFIQAMQMPMLPADPMGLVMAQLGLFQGVDEDKGAAYFFLSDEAMGMPLMAAAGSGMPDVLPMAVVFGGSSVPEVFGMYSPAEEGENYAFLLNGLKVYAREVKGYLVLSTNPKAVAVVAESSRSMMDAADAKRGQRLAGMDLFVALDMKAMAPILDVAMSQFNAQMAAASAYMGPEEAQSIKMVQGIFAMGIQLMKQVAVADFGLSFSAERIQIDKFVQPIAGTDLAELLKAIQPTGKSLLAGLPAENYFAAIGTDFGKVMTSEVGLKATHEMTRWSLSLMGSDLDQAVVDGYVDGLLKHYGDAYVSRAVLRAEGAEADQPLAMLCLTRMSQPEAYLDYVAENIDIQRQMMARQLAAMGGEASMDYQVKAETVEGMRVDKLTIVPPANYPGPDMGFFTTYTAPMDNELAAATVSASMLAKLAAPDALLADRPEVQVAFKALPAKPFMAGMLNLPATYACIVDVVNRQVAGMEPELENLLKQVAPTTTELIAFGASVEDGQIHGRGVLPAGLFRDVAKAVMTIQMQMGGMGGPSGPPPQDF